MEIAGVVAIAALVVFYKLHVSPVFWWDEARVAANSLEMITSPNPLIVTFNGQADLWNTKPPLAIWLNALSMKAFGVNELALRLPSALAAVGTVLAVYLFSRRISQSRLTALLAALILLGTGGYIEVHVARTADFDSLLVLFVTLATFSLFMALENPERGRRWFYATAASLAGAIFTKSVAGLLMGPGYILYVAWSGQLRTVFSNSAVWLSAAAVLASALIFLAAREMSEPGYAQAAWMQDVARFGVPADGNVGAWYDYLVGLLSPWQFRLLVTNEEFFYEISAFPWILLVPLAALPLSEFPSPSVISRAAAYLLCCLVVFLFMASAAETMLVWYIAPAYPLIAVLAAVGISRLQTIVGWKWSLHAGIVFAAACVAANLWKLEKYATYTLLSPEGWSASYLRSLDLPPSAKVRVVGELTWHTPAVKDGRVVGSEPYYGPLEFYTRNMRARGHDIRAVSVGYVARRGEVIIACGDQLRPFRSLTVLKKNGRCFALRA